MIHYSSYIMPMNKSYPKCGYIIGEDEAPLGKRDRKTKEVRKKERNQSKKGSQRENHRDKRREREEESSKRDQRKERKRKK